MLALCQHNTLAYYAFYYAGMFDAGLICDQLYEKGSYNLSKFSTLVNHISAGFQIITFTLHQTIVVCWSYIKAKFQTNAKFTSQVMGF